MTNFIVLRINFKREQKSLRTNFSCMLKNSNPGIPQYVDCRHYLKLTLNKKGVKNALPMTIC